jgi:hypothetical protein
VTSSAGPPLKLAAAARWIYGYQRQADGAFNVASSAAGGYGVYATTRKGGSNQRRQRFRLRGVCRRRRRSRRGNAEGFIGAAADGDDTVWK